MKLRMLWGIFVLVVCAGRLNGQAPQQARPLPPGYGSLSQNDIALRVQNDDIEIRFIPLNPRLLPLLAPDAYQSLRRLLETNHRGIDSVASLAGVSQPGLAMVSFFGRRSDVRFDPQILTLTIRSRIFRPLGFLPLTPKFSSQQLGVRDQVSAIYLFEEDLPIDDSFVLTYTNLTADWVAKQQLLNRERARIASRSRGERPETLTTH